MTDGIIKGTGNSRFLKGPANAAALYPDFESFRDAWAAGTLPVDFNGINPAGWEVVGDKLDKSTLLTDALCTALGIPTTSTPTQAMDMLRRMVNNKSTMISGSYSGTASTTDNHTDYPQTITLPFSPKAVFVFRNGRVDSPDEGHTFSGLALSGKPLYSYPNTGNFKTIALEIINNGFIVHERYDSYPSGASVQVNLNKSSYTYYYVALS